MLLSVSGVLRFGNVRLLGREEQGVGVGGCSCDELKGSHDVWL